MAAEPLGTPSLANRFLSQEGMERPAVGTRWEASESTVGFGFGRHRRPTGRLSFMAFSAPIGVLSFFLEPLEKRAAQANPEHDAASRQGNEDRRQRRNPLQQAQPAHCQDNCGIR